jgi:hypothetical protein
MIGIAEGHIPVANPGGPGLVFQMAQNFCTGRIRPLPRRGCGFMAPDSSVEIAP